MTIASHRLQRGAYLLEVLIATLIFALGVLGIVGLQAASLRTNSDTQLRAEAVMAASQLIGQMWSDSVGNLSNYDSSLGGASYQNFADQLKAVQGGAWAANPMVTVDGGCSMGATPPSQTSHTVAIQIFWLSPSGEASLGCGAGNLCHSYLTCAVIGQNS
jgi:type IV pilus assembly protein PilV